MYLMDVARRDCDIRIWDRDDDVDAKCVVVIRRLVAAGL